MAPAEADWTGALQYLMGDTGAVFQQEEVLPAGLKVGKPFPDRACMRFGERFIEWDESLGS